jgi:hypothetical protein
LTKPTEKIAKAHNPIKIFFIKATSLQNGRNCRASHIKAQARFVSLPGDYRLARGKTGLSRVFHKSPFNEQ